MSAPPPGTVHMVDLDGTMDVRHGEGKKDIVLIPQPSDHPDDPLNWSRNRKRMANTCFVVYTFFSGALCSCISPALLLISADTGIPVANINTGTGLLYLFMGWSNVILQPLALTYGRRPILLFSMFGTSFMALWAAYTKSTGEWYANRILMGCTLGPIETLIEVCIADVYFTHQRGNYLSYYTWALWCNTFLGPIAAGFVANRYGWQWIQYIVTILGFAAFIFLFFCLEETMFFRQTVQEEFIDRTQKTAQAERSLEQVNKSAEVAPVAASGEKLATIERQGSAGEGVFEYRKKPYTQKLKVWGLRDPQQPFILWKTMILPFVLLRFPVVIFSGLVVGAILSWFNVVNGTLATILGAAPYNFNSDMLGVVYISCAIGCTFGCYFAGTLSDWVAVFLARRNNGIREPEHRLWVAVIPFLLHPAGAILYGVGAAQHIHWVGIAFGLGFIGLCLPMGASVAFNYILDSYKEIGGEAVTAAILIRNTMGFAFAYAIVPMISSLGLQDSFILVAFLGMAIWGLCFIMIVFGKKARIATARAYWNMVEQHGHSVH